MVDASTYCAALLSAIVTTCVMYIFRLTSTWVPAETRHKPMYWGVISLLVGGGINLGLGTLFVVLKLLSVLGLFSVSLNFAEDIWWILAPMGISFSCYLGAGLFYTEFVKNK